MTQSLLSIAVVLSLVLFVLGMDHGIFAMVLPYTSLWMYTVRSARRWANQSSKPQAIHWSGSFLAPEFKEILFIERKAKQTQSKIKPQARDSTQKTKASPSPKEVKAEFRKPIFTGLPHDVLGVDQDANSNLIQAAHRFWLKRYHPDLAAKEKTSLVQDQNQKAQCLNQARENMMKERKKKRAA